MRLHFHTSCSYRVLKSYSYRVFSLQEFKQNDQKHAAAVVIIALPKKQVKEKRDNRKVCMKPWLKIRKIVGFY